MEIIEKESNIMNDLVVEALKNNKLFMVEVDVTESCNCNCFFCFQGNVHQERDNILTLDKITSILDELESVGCYHLSFSGGEPFCRKDFLEILREAKKRGFLVTLATNLQIPSIEEVEELGKIGLAKILVSFHSSKPSIYSDIFGISEDMYWKTLENIRILLKSKTPVGIAVTVSDRNAKELDDILELFMSLGIEKDNIRFNPLIESGNPITEHRAGDLLKEYLPMHQHLRSNILSKVRTRNYSFICSAGKASCVIKPNGDVLPCGLMNCVAGSIKDTTLMDVWNKSHVLKIFRSLSEGHFTKCQSCDYLEYCPICMATNLNESGIYHVPSEEYCVFRKNISDSFGQGGIENENK